jgi:uncharacterized membrane protein
MKPSITSAVLALLVATNYVDAFSASLAKVKTRIATPRFLPHQMVMDNRDPLGIASETDTAVKKSTDPTPIFVSMLQDLTADTSKMQMAAAAMAVTLAFLPLPSDAAMSGGRMGGSFSAPRMSAPRMSPSSGRGYSSGYSSGYNSRSTVILSPGLGGGYGYNPGYYGGAGAMSYSRGPDIFSLVLVGGVLYTVANSFLRGGNTASSDYSSSVTSSLGPGTSVVQLSVAIEVPDRDDPNSILSVFDKLANTARTDSRVGIQNLTSQVALELLRRRSSIVSASSSYEHFGDRNRAGREFQSRSVQERSKFEKETVSKYGDVDYGARSDVPATAGTDKATMAVVTLVIAIDGDSTKIPNINSISDVEEALRRIASDVKVDDCLQSSEILWTPEERSETVSLREVVADYPELRAV